MKLTTLSLFILLSLIFHTACNKQTTLDLSGEWAFQTDPHDKGISEKWFTCKLNESVNLPGSMTTNGKGNDIIVNNPWTGQIVDSSWFKDARYEKYRREGNIKVPFWLQPIKYYIGAAWYQKTVDIPANWKGKSLQLFLERCHWETRVWVDDREAGMRNSLSAPHVYDLTTFLTPGQHTITICIDNRVKDIQVGQNSHSISDHTQTNWNGIIGRMELQSRTEVYISNISVFPDIAHKKISVKVSLTNISGRKVTGKIRLAASSDKTESEKISPLESDFSMDGIQQQISLEYPMGSNPLLWDEFHPNIYKLAVSVKADNLDADFKETTFGMREFKVKGTQFSINGRPTFLRGTLECAIFPKTGYPPTDTAAWGRIFRIARAHGLNHFRFHSWCPPAAAFEAADKAGFYLQVEGPSWANQGASIGNGAPIDKFLYDESERIVAEYGNHPSFCMLLYGNEPAGANQKKWLGEFDTYWKNKDNRRLYSSGSGWPIIPESDFNSTSDPRIQQWGQGLNSIINAQPPCSDYDWSRIIASFNKATVSHEIGQWCVYPDFKEIKQYDGVLRAKNFEIFQETLQENGMGALADSFLLASGKLQALCYKADIEAALRTPGFGGFQLLDLHDFPGQGTALVGILNPFWKEKGYISPKEYSRFCNSTVPLARLPKMVYTNADTLWVPVEIAHFGEKAFSGVTPEWKITDENGKTIFKGQFASQDIPLGNGTKLGTIKQELTSVTKAQKLKLSVTAGVAENYWDIWVFPAVLPKLGKDILITQTIDSKAAEVLAKGGKVLLTIKKGSIKPEKGGSVAVGFSSIFWNTAWTQNQAPHTLGILCNPKHPALADFPTDYYSNWQWWDAMSHCNAFNLTDLPKDIKPIVRIIDDWVTNRPLGLIFEVKVGDGKMLVCGADLLTGSSTRPEARQLLFSLTNYMEESSFNPSTSINLNEIKKYFSYE
jgi:hypothetical protein